MPKKDIILGSVSVGFGAWVYYIASTLKKKAAFWPKIVAAGIIILGLIILVMGILNLRNKKAGAQKKLSKEQANYLRVLAVVALMVIFYFIFKYVSYILAAFILMVGTSVVLGYRNWKVLLPTACIMSVGLYLAFSQLFNVHFPGAFF